MIGDIFGAVLGYAGTRRQNQTNIKLARENRAWQEMMSNTAYQRSANDLEKAGLNRILALGNSASTPNGNVAQVENEMESAVSTAIALKRAKAEVANIQASTEKAISETSESNSRRYTQQVQRDLLEQQIETGAYNAWLASAKYNAAKQVESKVQESVGTTAKKYQKRPWTQDDYNTPEQLKERMRKKYK